MMTIKLEGKEYQIDIEQAEKLGLLKKIDDRVRSWEDYRKKYYNKFGYFQSNTITIKTHSPLSDSDQLTPHESKAMSAFSKLIKLRRDWVGEWEPDFTKDDTKWAIYCRSNNVVVDWTTRLSHPLSFPTIQMAQEFLETFHDLIEDAKILI